MQQTSQDPDPAPDGPAGHPPVPPPETVPSSPLGRTTLSSLVDAAGRAQRAQRSIRPATVGVITALVGGLAIVLVIWGVNAGLPGQLIVGIAMVFIGVAVGWTQVSFIMDDQLHPETHTNRTAVVVAGCAIGMTILGVLVAFSLRMPIHAVLQGAAAGLVMLVAVGLIIAPWWISLVSDLGMQRARTAREELRADIAARLHDSVLQTLALIQLQATDATKVAALARTQERELREWLYGDPEAVASGARDERPAETRRQWDVPAPSEDEPLSRALKRVAAHVEDFREKPIDVVIVGDCPYTAALSPLLDAAAEAMSNAAKHGAPPISVYMETSPGKVQVYVRDHGDGFDVTQLPAGHLGVKESIVGRMNRAGGAARIVSRPGWGTEVQLTQPV